MDRINSILTPTENDERHAKAVAYSRRKWLSKLLKTGNKKVIDAYEKYDRLCAEDTENSGIMPKSGAVAPVKPLTIRELSKMSNAEIADYLNNYQETEIIGMPFLAGRGLADTLAEYVEAEPQHFTDNLLPFQSVRNLYQSSLLRGFLNAWKDKKHLTGLHCLDLYVPFSYQSTSGLSNTRMVLITGIGFFLLQRIWYQKAQRMIHTRLIHNSCPLLKRFS